MAMLKGEDMELKIGERLAELRTNCRYTQDDLAEKLSVSSNTISTWETDQGCPSLDHLLALSELYGVSLDDLVCHKEREEYPFRQRYIPFRHIRSTTFGYYPETYVDYVEDLENELYTAWIWTSYYPYKRCVYSMPVKNISLDDFMDFIQDHADSFLNQFFEELKKLRPAEELTRIKEQISIIAAHEEFADMPYNRCGLE